MGTFNLNKVEKEDETDKYYLFNCYYIPKLDPKVSGYFQLFYDLPITTYAFAFNFNYFGNSSFAKQMFEPLMHLNPYQSPENCNITETDYFWDFQSLSGDTS